MNSILLEDINYIHNKLSDHEKEMYQDSSILLTGCAGFLGFNFLNYFCEKAKELGIKKIVGIDNFIVGKPEWINDLSEKYDLLEVIEADLLKTNLKSLYDDYQFNICLHMASIASPVFYRKYPLETMDANITVLRQLLEIFNNESTRSFLFFSSSEIYGDPTPENIPTPETYWGNVSCTGPRACYDESKRYGETLCEVFGKTKNMPVVVVRPFNNYGPGMKLNDKRVPADFANNIINGNDITLFSDGSPTRTFCYIADAITGYLKVMAHRKYDFFNIGMDKPEIPIKRLAEIYKEAGKKIFNFDPKVNLQTSEEKDYLTNNPNRRCPNITKAREILNFNPEILVEDGVQRFLSYLKEENQ